MHRRLLTIVAVAAVSSLFGGYAIGQNTVLNNKYSNDPQTVECRDASDQLVGTITYDGPLKMWPPNHKYQDISIVAQAADANDGVELFTAGTHDEMTDGEEMNGAGNTDNDVSPPSDMESGTGSATAEHSLRSERSGRGDGRTYTLDWDVIFTDDDADGGYGTVYCGSADLNGDGEPPVDARADAFEVVVPHDMRGGADFNGNNGNNGNGNGNGNGNRPALQIL